MILTHLIRNEGFAWRECPSALGRLRYKGNEWEIGQDLRAWLASSVLTIETLVEKLRAATYPFAVVLERPGEVWAAVDSLRTHPLFVAGTGSCVIVTDDPYSPNLRLDTEVDDSLARAEFVMAGYPLGRKTLSRGIRALQAGETLHVKSGEEGPTSRFGRLRGRLDDHGAAEVSPATWAAALMSVSDEIFSRLCAGLSGRQVLVPLSSGYDSRFLAAMLKRHGYANVLTYAYGRPENWEIAASRETARKLGYRWTFIPYSREEWRRWYDSASMRDYLPFASRHVSTPHVQDWPAVRELKEQGVVQPDAIFLPGHTAMLTGNRLERWVLDVPEEKRLDALAAVLYRHHFVLLPASRAGVDARSVLADLRSELPEALDADNHRLLNVYYSFETAERHAKLVVNSVRVYEFFGHRWAVPLWDERYVRLWARVPYEGRVAKRWLRDGLVNAPLYGVFDHEPSPSAYARIRQRMKDNRHIYPRLKWLRDLRERLFGYYDHYLDWYGIVDYREYLRRMGHGGSIYSILSQRYLERPGTRGPSGEPTVGAPVATPVARHESSLEM